MKKIVFVISESGYWGEELLEDDAFIYTKRATFIQQKIGVHDER